MKEILDWKKYNNALFLDRDGVINLENPNGYILSWNDFIFYDGVLESFKKFANHFKYIFIITNQRGVGRGLMNLNDLLEIHEMMTKKIQAHGGRIDKIYFCADLDKHSFNRKPNIGMALQAQKAFPEIDVSKSIMVGNKLSDMEFGKNVGLKNVLISTTNPELENHVLVNLSFSSLWRFAKEIS